MEGLVLFLAGMIIALYTEDVPKWVKTIIWVVFVVLGLVYGAAHSFHLP